MSLNIDKAQLDEVLAELAEDIAKERSLAKAEGETSPDEESEGSSGPAAPPAEASAPADEGSAPPAAAPEGAPPEASAPAAAPPDQAGEIEPAPTVEQLSAEYKQLGAQDPEALKMHYLACKQAIVELMGADQGAPEASAPPAAAPHEASAPPSAPPAAAPPPAFKAEMKPSPGNGGKLGKSETDIRIEALEKSLSEEKARNAEYDTKLVNLVNVMSTPIRKSVKGVSDLKFVTRADETSSAKGAQPLSKADFGPKLREKLRGGLKLSKSDADLVAGFDMGKVDFSKVQHLIADAK